MKGKKIETSKSINERKYGNCWEENNWETFYIGIGVESQSVYGSLKRKIRENCWKINKTFDDICTMKKFSEFPTKFF